MIERYAIECNKHNCTPLNLENRGGKFSHIRGGQNGSNMPLYDCMFLLKPHLPKEALMDLATRVGKHIYARNGVITEIKSFGTVQLGYGIKKLDGRYYQGSLMQMTMMATPNINKELHYLNKEDRLLRWLLVKHRDVALDSFEPGKLVTGDVVEEDVDDFVGEPGDNEYEVGNKE